MAEASEEKALCGEMEGQWLIGQPFKRGRMFSRWEISLATIAGIVTQWFQDIWEAVPIQEFPSRVRREAIGPIARRQDETFP